MKYRRVFVPGGCYFFTVVTEKRRPVFASGEAVVVLRDAFRAVRLSYPFELDAMVVLPDYLHCIWTLPPEDQDFSARWRLIKTWFTKHCDGNLRVSINKSRANKSQQAIWQHRFWEHVIRDERDYQNHVDYIHYNPVKHGYVERAIDWPYSSFQRFVSNGFYPEDWGSGEISLPKIIGRE